MPVEPALAGQVALVTGGSRGIGLAIARKLGGMGARLALCARNATALDAAAASLRAAGSEVLAVPADVTDPAQVAALVQHARNTFGSIHILVNNAGVGWFGPFQECSAAQWDAVWNTNVKAALLMCQAVAPQMIERRAGHIINISSLAGKNAFAGGAVYCASKWGLQGLSYCLAEELRGYGIRVSVVCPGTVATAFSPHAGKDAAKMLQPDDVAHAVAALVTQSPQSFISEVLIRPTQKP